MDINNLTVVEELTFFACWASYIYNNPDKNAWLWFKKNNIGFSAIGFPADNHKLDDLIDIVQAKRYLQLNNGAWTFKKSFYNKCRAFAWPSVKLKQYGYTREKALAEARGVIEFVKRRYEEVK